MYLHFIVITINKSLFQITLFFKKCDNAGKFFQYLFCYCPSSSSFAVLSWSGFLIPLQGLFELCSANFPVPMSEIYYLWIPYSGGESWKFWFSTICHRFPTCITVCFLSLSMEILWLLPMVLAFPGHFH